MPDLALCVFGPLQLSRDGAPVTGLESTKVRALLIYLAMEADRPHARAALADLLWPDEPAPVAQHNLRQALANLRQALGDRTTDPPFLLITRETVQFNPASSYWLDVAVYTGLLAACDTHPHRRASACTSCAERRASAATLYRGDFLAHFALGDSAAFEEWASLTRERLRQQALEALSHLAAHEEQRGAYAAAQRYAWREIKLDPWNEEAHRQLMRGLWLSGQRHAALAHYERCRLLLRQELGVDPAPETTTLYAHIRDTARDAAPRNQNAGNLPAPSTPFIGREDELAQLADLLQHPACRLITLTGPGGIGKTRLALQTAGEASAVFADGVCFVDLAALHTTELLVPTIATALSVVLDGRADPKTQLLRYLRAKDLLLVLDNFEHLLSGAPVAAGLVAEILQSAPLVTLLVTSRERLHLQGEWVVDIVGLPYPSEAQCEELEGYSAVQLFLQGARRAHTGFAVAVGELPSVARICRLVEGMPLGIELAAPWVRILTCQEIARELEQSMRLLASSRYDLPARHQSLQAVLAHSWDLLTEGEQRVLRRLAVFRGGVERAAAEHVAGASLPVLAALVDKSLLRQSRHTTNTCRFDLHELVRQYGEEELAATREVEVLRRRHAEYFLALAEEAEQALYTSAHVVSWLDRLALEHDNVRVALAWSLTAVDGCAIGLRIAGALRHYWAWRGHVSEGGTWLERLLTRASPAAARALPDLAGDPVELYAQATALRAAGFLAELQGALGQAPVLLEQSAARFRQLGRTSDLARALWALAHCARQQGQWTRTSRIVEESLALYQEVGEHVGIGWCLWLLSEVARECGDVARAQALGERAAELARACGHPVLMAYVLFALSRTTFAQGDVTQARTQAEEALLVGQELGHVPFQAQVMLEIGRLAAAQGDEAHAAALWEETLALARRTQHQRALAESLLELGRLAHRQHDDRQARALLVESLRLYRERGHPGFIVECLVGLAQVRAVGCGVGVPSSSGTSRAARLLGAVDALCRAGAVQRRPWVRADTERALAATRDQLDEEAFAAAWAEGQVMTLEEAIAYALEETPDEETGDSIKWGAGCGTYDV